MNNENGPSMLENVPISFTKYSDQQQKKPAHVSGLILPDVSYHGTARNKGRRDFIEALGSKERLIYVAISRSRTTFKFPQGNL